MDNCQFQLKVDQDIESCCSTDVNKVSGNCSKVSSSLDGSESDVDASVLPPGAFG